LPNLDLSGTVAVNLAGAQPQLTAQLASEKLDLRPFLAHTQGQTAQQPKATRPATRKDRVFPQEPLSLGGMPLVDATVELRARQFLTPRLALHDLAVHLVLQDGHLTVNPVQARMGGGSLAGQVKLQPVGKAAQVALVLNLNRVDIGHMARELQVTDILDGKLDAAVEVRGRGDSVAAIMAGLQGKTGLVMGKGKLDNKYIELIGADLGVSLFRLVNPFAQDQQRTDINCLVSRFDIQDGMARSSALVFDTPNMSIVGDGQIDLKTEALDFSLKPSPKEGAGVSGLGRVGLSLSELARPFKLGGTLAQPSLAVDATQAALTVGKSLGGTVLFGPAGIVAALMSGSGAESENPCVEALEAAKTGAKPATKAREDVKDTLEKATKDIGTGLKKLFGR
jgi:AsmA family protein